MTLEQLARQGRHVGMAEISALEGDNLRRIRKANIKAAFLGEESLRHRCEFVDNIEKVPYIDDANATSFDATWFNFSKLNHVASKDVALASSIYGTFSILSTNSQR